MSDYTIRDYLEALKVERSEEKSVLLERYVDEIMLFNPSLKLVGSKERDDIVFRHIFDCISAYDVFLHETNPGDKIADLGSGAGLPGIVLSILFPDREFVLIERMSRRVGFLRTLIASLHLKNVTVLDKDISQIRDTFSLVTCRAFHPLEDVIKEIIPLSRKGIFYKGTLKSINEEFVALKAMGYSFEGRIVSVTVPSLFEERNIVVIEDLKKDEER